MNCERSRELFADYLGEELARGEAQQLQLHLKTCQGCRQELSLLASTKATLKQALPEVAMPRHLSFNFSKPQPQGWFEWLRQPRYATLAAVTACFVICLASLALFRAQLEMRNGDFRISFGEPLRATSPDAEERKPSSPVSATREEVQVAIQQAVQRLRDDQDSRMQQELQKLKFEVETNRQSDRKQVVRGFKFLEETQSLVWKEAAKNSSYLDTIARDLFVKASSTQQ
jgi:putative zinc finger protein